MAADVAERIVINRVVGVRMYREHGWRLRGGTQACRREDSEAIFVIVEQRLGIDDHLRTIFEAVIVVNCIGFCFVKGTVRRVKVGDARVWCCWVKQGMGGHLALAQLTNLESLTIVQVLAQADNALTRKHAEDRPLMLRELYANYRQ